MSEKEKLWVSPPMPSGQKIRHVGYLDLGEFYTWMQRWFEFNGFFHDNFERFYEEEGLPTGVTYLFEHEKNIYVATDKGLYKHENGQFKIYNGFGVDFSEERGLIFALYSPMLRASARGIPVPFGVGFGFFVTVSTGVFAVGLRGLRNAWND